MDVGVVYTYVAERSYYLVKVHFQIRFIQIIFYHVNIILIPPFNVLFFSIDSVLIFPFPFCEQLQY